MDNGVAAAAALPTPAVTTKFKPKPNNFPFTEKQDLPINYEISSRP
jgi:hypothetical protein